MKAKHKKGPALLLSSSLPDRCLAYRLYEEDLTRRTIGLGGLFDQFTDVAAASDSSSGGGPRGLRDSQGAAAAPAARPGRAGVPQAVGQQGRVGQARLHLPKQSGGRRAGQLQRRGPRLSSRQAVSSVTPLEGLIGRKERDVAEMCCWISLFSSSMLKKRWSNKQLPNEASAANPLFLYIHVCSQ